MVLAGVDSRYTNKCWRRPRSKPLAVGVTKNAIRRNDTAKRSPSKRSDAVRCVIARRGSVVMSLASGSFAISSLVISMNAGRRGGCMFFCFLRLDDAVDLLFWGQQTWRGRWGNRMQLTVVTTTAAMFSIPCSCDVGAARNEQNRPSLKEDKVVSKMVSSCRSTRGSAVLATCSSCCAPA